jgi:hypothetical protein
LNIRFLSNFQYKILNLTNGKIYYKYSDVLEDFQIEQKNISGIYETLDVAKLCYENKIQILNTERHEQLIEKYTKYLEWLSLEPERKSKKQKETSERFLLVPKTEEQKKKIGLGQKRWIKNNQALHFERMLKINKNPDKIKKTAETHTGMKRSEQAKQNMKNAWDIRRKNGTASSGTKDKIPALNKETNKIKYFCNIDEIDLDLYTLDLSSLHKPGAKIYFNGDIYKKFYPGDTIPDGWIKKGPPKRKKANADII